MAINQDAYLRYTILDRCLSNHARMFDREDLIQKIEEEFLERKGEDRNGVNKRVRIGKTQFFYDLKALEDAPFFAEIERVKDKFDKRKVYYRYADPTFSIRNTPLSDEEKEYLKSSISLLERISGLPTFELLQEVLPFLKTKLGVNHVENPVMGFENNPDYSGLRHISDLFNAIVHQRVVEVVYQPFQDEPKRILFHPYYLKEFNSRWFIWGFSPNMDKPLVNLALDRICEPIFEKGNEVYLPKDINWDEYFEDVIGVSIPETELEQIKVKVTAKRAPYLLTKPLHLSQKNRTLENGEVELRIKVKVNNELISLLLSFGSDLEVMEPNWLREKMKSELEQLILRYSASNASNG